MNINDEINKSGLKPLSTATTTRKCIVKRDTIELKGHFHKWCDITQCIEPSQSIVRNTVALVELEDGSVIQCDPIYIVFNDDPYNSKHNEIAFKKAFDNLQSFLEGERRRS